MSRRWLLLAVLAPTVAAVMVMAAAVLLRMPWSFVWQIGAAIGATVGIHAWAEHRREIRRRR